MRFITFLGLIIIAKCINDNKIAEGTGFIIPILVIALLIDIAEWNKRDGK